MSDFQYLYIRIKQNFQIQIIFLMVVLSALSYHI